MKPGTTAPPQASKTTASGVRSSSFARSDSKPTKTIRPWWLATAARSIERASPCAGPRRGAGPAQVSTSDALRIRKSASNAPFYVVALADDLARRVLVGVVRRIDVAWAMEQDLLVAVAGLLFAHVVERVAQGLDRRLDRGLDILTLQLQSVDLALDVLETRGRLFEQQIRSSFGVAHDPLRILLGMLPDVVGELLRRHQRVVQAFFVTKMLGDRGLGANQLLAQAVRFAKGLFVIVGHRGEKRG